MTSDSDADEVDDEEVTSRRGSHAAWCNEFLNEVMKCTSLRWSVVGHNQSFDIPLGHCYAVHAVGDSRVLARQSYELQLQDIPMLAVIWPVRAYTAAAEFRCTEMKSIADLVTRQGVDEVRGMGGGRATSFWQKAVALGLQHNNRDSTAFMEKINRIVEPINPIITRSQ